MVPAEIQQVGGTRGQVVWQPCELPHRRAGRVRLRQISDMSLCVCVCVCVCVCLPVCLSVCERRVDKPEGREAVAAIWVRSSVSLNQGHGNESVAETE